MVLSSDYCEQPLRGVHPKFPYIIICNIRICGDRALSPQSYMLIKNSIDYLLRSPYRLLSRLKDSVVLKY